MQVLITGVSGFVGRSLARYWAGPAIGVSRHCPGFLGSWTWLERGPTLARGLSGVELVVHLEAKQHVFHPAQRDIDEYESVNVGGTVAWLKWCERNGIGKFIYFSSIKAVHAEEGGLTDESAPGPSPSAYGGSKWRAEECVRAWVAADNRRSGLIIRPAVVYGVGSASNMAAMVEAIQRGQFFLIGANSNVKSIVSTKNLAMATQHLIRCMQPGGCEVFNVSDAQNYSVRELDRLIRRLQGKKGNSPTLPLALGRAAACFGDGFHALTGRMFSINSSRLDALLEWTFFSCNKLIGSGFVHPQTTEAGLAEML